MAMEGFLNQIFKKEQEEVFAKAAPFVSLLADLILLYYIKTSMLPRMFGNKAALFNSLVKMNPAIRYLAKSEFDSMIELMQSTFILVFTLIIGFNAVMYVLASRKKKWGIKFVYGYTFSTSLLSILELAGSVVLPYPFSWATLITTFLYLYVYLGMKHFKQNLEQ